MLDPQLKPGPVHHVFAIVCFALLSIVMTWPLAANLERSVAYPGDPYINAWILHWDYVATITNPADLFHAPIFHPMRYGLALSEHLYGIALFCMPLFAAGLKAVTVYNIAMLAGFTFSGYAAYLLCRHVTGSAAAAMIGGIFFAFNPWRFTHLSHLQHMWAGWLPLLLLAFIAYAQKPRVRTAILFGVAFLMNGLTNMHWFIFGSTAIALTALTAPLLYPRLRRVRSWFPLLAATVTALILLLPFLLPYREVSRLYGLQRGEAETLTYSALPADWFVSGFQNRLYGFRTNDGSTDPERWLFTGVIILILAAISLFARDGEGRQTGYSPEVGIGVLWVILGVIGSFGLNFFFHRFLFEHIDLFRSIRVPARWAMISYTGLALLGAVGAKQLSRGLSGHSRSAALSVLGLIVLFELRAAPIRWYFAPVETPDVYQWLDRNPLSGAILELPIDDTGSEYHYLLRATTHRQPLVNGVSGFAPRHFLDLVSSFRQPSIPDVVLPFLEKSGVSAVIVHSDVLPPQQSKSVREWLRRGVRNGQLTFVSRFEAPTGGDYLFALNRNEPLASWNRPANVPDAAGRTPLQNLELFLSGNGQTYNGVTFGFLDSPTPNAAAKGSLRVFGWALSPHAVVRVRLLFGNGRTVHEAELAEYPAIHEVFPWYPQTKRAAFHKEFAQRPEGIEDITDLQVEIIDGRGKTTRLPHIWFDWRE